MYVLLVVLLVLVILGLPPIGVIPQPWGYGPSSALSIIVVVLLVLILLGRL